MEDELNQEWEKEKKSFGEQESAQGMAAVTCVLSDARSKVYRMEAKLRDHDRQSRGERDQISQLGNDKRIKAKNLHDLKQAFLEITQTEIADLEAKMRAKESELLAAQEKVTQRKEALARGEAT